jgi:rod shape-determining protein MreD
MRRFFSPLLVGIFLLTVQTTLWTSLSLQRWRPDILLILILFLAFSYPPISGGILAFLMGYLMDLFSGNTIGLYTLSRPLLFYGVKHFRNRFYLEGFQFQFLFVSLSALFEGLFIVILLASLSPSPLSYLHFSLLIPLLPQSACTGLIAPMLFFLLDKGMILLAGRHE